MTNQAQRHVEKPQATPELTASHPQHLHGRPAMSISMRKEQVSVNLLHIT